MKQMKTYKQIKKIKIYSSVFSFLFMTISFMLFMHYIHENVPWFIICFFSILFGISYTWIWNKVFYSRLDRIQSNLLKKEPELGQPILERVCLSHFRGFIADGGVGYLLSDKLIFIPHKMNSSRKQLTIQLSDIKDISGYKILGIFNTGLKITLKSGNVEKFVIDKSSEFYKNLLSQFA